MSFDFEQAFKDAANTMKSSFTEDLPGIDDYWKEILDNEKEALQLITEQRIKGNWKQDKFENELKREQEVLEIELLAIEIMTKAAAQKAINAGFKVLKTAVEAALPF